MQFDKFGWQGVFFTIKFSFKLSDCIFLGVTKFNDFSVNECWGSV